MTVLTLAGGQDLSGGADCTQGRGGLVVEDSCCLFLDHPCKKKNSIHSAENIFFSFSEFFFASEVEQKQTIY